MLRLVKTLNQTDSLGKALGKVIVYIIITVIVLALVQWIFTSGMEILAKTVGYEGFLALKDYSVYVYIIILFIMGWMIVNAVASMFYSMVTPKYGASTGAAIRSLIRILGLGALIAGIAGGVAGGAAGVALGGFIGLVIGFATQQVLGQAIAGLFILLARPFKINDIVDVAGESEVVVRDISTLFTVVERKDGLTVLVPSTMIIGQKIVVRKRAEQ